MSVVLHGVLYPKVDDNGTEKGVNMHPEVLWMPNWMEGQGGTATRSEGRKVNASVNGTR